MQNKGNNLNTSDGIDFKRYLRLFKRRKWIIIFISIFCFLFIAAVAIKLSPQQKYTTNSLLQFEDRRALSGENSPRSSDMDSKIGMLSSRTFLSRVVDNMGLKFWIWGVSRHEAIDSVKLSENPLEANYVIKKQNNMLALYYSDENRDIKDSLVVRTAYPQDNRISFGGFEIFLKKSYWNNKNKLPFTVFDENYAAQMLLQSLDFRFKSGSNSLFQISITGTDRVFITKILNDLVDEFIDQNLSVKKHYTREVVQILNSQLEQAKEELDLASDKLKNFQQRNPFVGLSGNASGLVSDVSSLESSKKDMESKKNELDVLLNRIALSGQDDTYSLLKELLAYLSSQGSATSGTLSLELNSLLQERNQLSKTYAPTHPLLVENENKLSRLQDKILFTANNFKSTLQNNVENADSQIDLNNSRIHRLPAKELTYAELQRNRNVADNIYSSLLIKLNQAKVADAVEVGDIIILDRAIVPRGKSRLSQIIRLLGLAFIFGIGLGFGSVIVLDFFDKTVRTPSELEKLVSIKVVAKIPVIGTEKSISKEDFEITKKIDPKLVPADYSPTPMGEAYRSLRTQLLLKNQENKRRSIFVTSLNPGEGKSLNAANLAITFAQQKIPTLLVDADLRRGMLHSSFACNKKPGLSDFLYSNAEISDENVRKVIQQTHIPNLYILSSGVPVPNPSEIIGSRRGEDVIRFLSERFGFVIVDTPPINVITDAVVIAQCTDTGLFVIRAGKTNIEIAKEKITEYENFQSQLFGLILNCSELDHKNDSYKYSYYNY